MAGPGARLLGLRRVDARNGGPVTVGDALIACLVQRAWAAVDASRRRRSLRATSVKAETLQTQLAEIKRENTGDPEARRRPLAEATPAVG